MPNRIQRSRRKGWRKPEGVVCVGRPSRFGNPFRIGAEYDREAAVAAYRAWITNSDRTDGPSLAEIRSVLRGRDLACWCPIGVPCHADVLLEIAN